MSTSFVPPSSTSAISSSSKLRRDKMLWTAKDDALLGTALDRTIAAQLQIGIDAVRERRQKLEIRGFGTAAPIPWTSEMDALCGTESDAVIAKALGLHNYQVRVRRKKLGIPSFIPWSERLKHMKFDLPPPAELLAAMTGRHLLVDQLQFKRSKTPLPDTEDQQLTAYLQRELNEVLSMSVHPPACPYCASRYTKLAHRPNATITRPGFTCLTCQASFNRLTGTPLARLRQAHLMPAFIQLLSQQIPYTEASRHLGLEYNAIQNWTKKFRLWLLQLDPSGKWEAKVRLGIKAQALIHCPRCGVDGEKNFIGLDARQGRKLLCPGCGASFSVRDAERLSQQKVRLEIRHDPGKVNRASDDAVRHMFFPQPQLP